MAKPKIHDSIKERLGYDPTISDREFLKDWKRRATRVCKPCWELKYCPYGPFVEQSPLMPPLRSEGIKHHEYISNCLKTGFIGEYGPLTDEQRVLYSDLLKLSDEEPAAFATYVKRSRVNIKQFEEALDEAESLDEVLSSGSLPPIHLYTPPFPFEEPKAKKPREVPRELQAEVNAEIERIKAILASNFLDNRRPLDEKRRKSFEAEVAAFHAEDRPEWVPPEVEDMECNIFGHICPVVFVSENISETSELRRRGRYIPFAVKMRVVRRDNHTCQECRRHLRDDEVEFDHIIPHSKGGSSEEHNIRLTCYDCNREKRDSVDI